MMTIENRSLEDTEAIAMSIAKSVEPGDIICLTGDLGAGKTTFTKSLCASLGVDELVNSPTFNIVNEYDGKFHVNHFDVYRIGDMEELYDIGFDDYIFSDSVSIIEWADIVREVLPREALWIDIRFVDDYRMLRISSESDAVENRFKGVLDNE
jgi:tRNA threonylcarbamoyladenosine biosynthesis protein TsaE